MEWLQGDILTMLSQPLADASKTRFLVKKGHISVTIR